MGPAGDRAVVPEIRDSAGLEGDFVSRGTDETLTIGDGTSLATSEPAGETLTTPASGPAVGDGVAAHAPVRLGGLALAGPFAVGAWSGVLRTNLDSAMAACHSDSESASILPHPRRREGVLWPVV
jgi:hypothetical protein